MFRYHIPMWIYAPAHVAPGRVERMVGQIDIAPTILGLLGMDYQSEFYGADIFQKPAGNDRAYIGTYQLLGYLRNDALTQLAPGQRVDAVSPAYGKNDPQPALALVARSEAEAIAAYQTASYRFKNGLMAR